MKQTTTVNLKTLKLIRKLMNCKVQGLIKTAKL